MGQPTSMIGHMAVAAQKTVRIIGAPVLFVGRAVEQALERLIPHGANELGSAIFTGSAYAPPVLHTPGPDKPVVAPPEQPDMSRKDETPPVPQPATGWGHQAPWGHKEVGYSPDHKIIDMRPQIESYEASMRAQTARLPRRQPEQGMER